MSQMPRGAAELEFDLLDRLRKSMRISGKDAGALAVDLGVHRNTVGNYLNGRTELDRRTLVAWAVSTGVPVEWLEHGTVVSPEPDPGQAETDTKDGSNGDKLARLTARKRDRAVTRRYLAA